MIDYLQDVDGSLKSITIKLKKLQVEESSTTCSTLFVCINSRDDRENRQLGCALQCTTDDLISDDCCRDKGVEEGQIDLGELRCCRL